MKKLFALLLVVAMVLSLAACKQPVDPTGTNPGTNPGTTPGTNPGTNPTDPVDDPSKIELDVVEGEFTYKSYSTALGSCWNPHAWETNAESSMMSYIETPLVSMSIDDSLNGVYQWIYLAATEVNDITASSQDILEKYDVTLPSGQSYADIKDGYVFEIKLNPNMKWQNGTPINADTYIYSMQQLLNPDMKNYRANLYYAGESMVAGGDKYYFSKDEGVYVGVYGKYATIADAQADGQAVYLDMHGFWGLAGALDENGNECPQWVDVTDTVKYQDPADGSWVSAADIYAAYAAYLANGVGYEAYVSLYEVNDDFGATYDAVGCYKVDDYTIVYVTQNHIDYYYFLTSLTSNWIVYEDLYEAGKETTGELVTTDYGTSIETTMSYGPYKMESLQEGKQLIYVQNENWYDYQTNENGYMYSVTDYKVDGEYIQQYQTTKVVIDIMDDEQAKQEFLKGNLSVWSPTADDLPTYSMSDQLYKADETYTMSFFFNTGVDALKAMDTSYGNTNSVVLSNWNFRKAFSMAINRDEWVGATAGYKPAYSILNSLYFYDVYNDPTSSYRNSDPAMQAICNLYGVKYGEGTPYATLKEAYDSINGYNLTEAKNLMKVAHDELVAAGLYNSGDPIHIRIGWAKGALTAADNQQLALIQSYLQAACEGSGFGTVTLEAVGNIPSRYDAVPNGEYAIGYGAWGGAAFYPFRNFQVYCDPDQYGVNEMGCWDPRTETLTINVNGEDITKTWQDWSGCMVGSGDLAGLDNTVKLQILAAMEEAYLNFVYRIPLASSTSCTMLSYQVNYYTDEYNIMYGFGGFDIMSYNYTDAEWADYVASVGGTLNYE